MSKSLSLAMLALAAHSHFSMSPKASALSITPQNDLQACFDNLNDGRSSKLQLPEDYQGDPVMFEYANAGDMICTRFTLTSKTVCMFQQEGGSTRGFLQMNNLFETGFNGQLDTFTTDARTLFFGAYALGTHLDIPPNIYIAIPETNPNAIAVKSDGFSWLSPKMRDSLLEQLKRGYPLLQACMAQPG